MRLILTTVLLAVTCGFLARGHLRDLGERPPRWPWLAFAGIALQLAPIVGTGGIAALLFSFVLLLVFVVANIRLPGFTLILVGLALNLAVIGANGGMPVTEHALIASGQADTLNALKEHGGSKHHLAGDDERLLFLGDVIAIGRPIRQAISVGDIWVHLGAAWFIIQGMRHPARRPEGTDASVAETA